jgi:hypothetical protein
MKLLFHKKSSVAENHAQDVRVASHCPCILCPALYVVRLTLRLITRGLPQFHTSHEDVTVTRGRSAGHLFLFLYLSIRITEASSYFIG